MALHTDRRYEEELAHLRQLVLEMGGLVERQIDATAKDLQRTDVRIVPVEAPALRLTDLTLETPEGRPLVHVASGMVQPGESAELARQAGPQARIFIFPGFQRQRVIAFRVIDFKNLPHAAAVDRANLAKASKTGKGRIGWNVAGPAAVVCASLRQYRVSGGKGGRLNGFRG